MILGIGIDSTTVARVAQKLAKPHFVRRVYSEEEQVLFASLAPHQREQTAAANFAAKEAFLKAAGTGLGGFALCDIAVLRKEGGAPYFVLAGAAAAWCGSEGITAHLSLTHEAGQATAFVVLEARVR